MYTPQQFLYLIRIAQISCKESVGNRVEEIYLEEVVSCASMSSRWFALAPSCDLQLVPPCVRSSFEFVCHELDMHFLGDISHIKELLYFIDSVQERLDVKVPTERSNLDLHPILVRTWVPSSAI